uniref:NADH-ubiquinone oxidoreductase chain 3 n=1 Tax=Acerentomon microrhinus TaxID=996308 RepID=A0A0C4FSS4_9HEXA|nr:NADH dehydrogenase subunit 3 [Acerentomon microrhinus]AFI54922.1 NADH dehydrogenase subunit 3 [Acerentomon microrhinus]
MLLLTLILCLLILIATWGLSKKTNNFREKASSFECGFEPGGGFRSTFSLRFFFILLMFLIFDVEIILILPMVQSMEVLNFFINSLVLVSFMFILFMGVALELSMGTLKWS